MPINPSILLGIKPPPNLAEMAAQQQDYRIRQQDIGLREQDRQLRAQEIQMRQRTLDQKTDPNSPEAQQKNLDLHIARAEYAARVLRNANEANWQTVRPLVIGALGEHAAAMLPEEFPGDDALKPFIAEGMSVKEQLEAAAKEAERIEKSKPKEPTEYTLGPGEIRYSGYGEELARGPEKPETDAKVGSFEDYVVRYATSKGKTPNLLTPADIEDARKRFLQADDRPRVTVQTGPTGALTQEGVDFAATEYRVTGKMPTLGQGNAQARAAIVNAAAQQAKALGQSPAVAMQKRAVFKADGAAYQQLDKASSSAEAFETKAIGQADIIADLSTKVPRLKWPIINGVLQSGRTQIAGDENATKLANAISTFTAEYAKIMEGSTGSAAGSSDSARRAAERLINTAMNKGTMAAVLELMKREMRLTIEGYDVAKAHVATRMGAAPTSTPSRQVVTRDKDGKLVFQKSQ